MTGSDLLLATRLGNYELVRLLAQGGMADIYLARPLGIGSFERYVAVKVLNRERANDPESCALFLDEARLVALMNHHNLAQVFEVDAQGGLHYLAMEYVHGADLRELLAAAQRADRDIPYETAVSIIAAAAAGLDHAHRRCGPDGKPLHLVHRDVSLSNIMVGHDGSVKVVDFGIATATLSSHHTNPGIVRGKASYMSPEQCVGDAVDLRTDVFALGVVLYELTTGRRCFHGATDFDRMLAVVRGEYVPPTDHVPDYPAALDEVVRTALALDPADRYSSGAALREALVQACAASGWTCGTAAIATVMTDLFGEVAEPWLGAAAADATSITVVPAPAMTWDTADLSPQPQPTVVLTKPRRLARGTESDVAREVSSSDDDEPTRGRRSAPRLRATRVAA